MKPGAKGAGSQADDVEQLGELARRLGLELRAAGDGSADPVLAALKRDSAGNVYVEAPALPSPPPRWEGPAPRIGGRTCSEGRAQLLAVWRGEAGKIAVIAAALGKSDSFVWRLLTGQRVPSLETARCIEERFGIPTASWAEPPRGGDVQAFDALLARHGAPAEKGSAARVRRFREKRRAGSERYIGQAVKRDARARSGKVGT